MATFTPPQVSHSPTGWGPIGSLEQFEGLPFVSFNKGDKVGRAADWTQMSAQPQFHRHANARMSGVNTIFKHTHEADDSFVTVDTRSAPKQKGFTAAKKPIMAPRPRKDAAGQKQSRTTPNTASVNQNPFRRNNRFDDGSQDSLAASVEVKPTWKLLDRFSLSQLNKLSGPIPEGQDLATTGSVGAYDRNWERTSARAEKRLEKSTMKPLREPLTTADPIIRELTAKRAGNVFATETVLALLACSPRSIYSWDIVVRKVRNIIFLEHSSEANQNHLTVNENAAELPTDDAESPNSASALSKEAVAINTHFLQQVYAKKTQGHRMQRPSPFATQGSLTALVGYRYRKWTLGDDIQLVARTRVDACIPGKDAEPTQLMSVFALNEFDSRFSGVDWRQKLDSQRGAVVSNELKINAHKLCKWTTQAILADVDNMKIGFVSRVNKDPNNHAVLGVFPVRPKDFANQINLQLDNIWAILKAILATLMKQPDGNYVLLREPNKPTIALYSIPDEEEDEDEEDEEEAEGDE
eukprot:TRINITY_DN2487_c0_g1_i1.p1 TRINITY_DN2487_c0_g1~~TRINITY_DN2487_c0_g1_i1.p1  ORF type:complete len:524 (-),score=125.11 TRINITY_DN2487_c0_g1_i1:254-1825(-)